MVLLVTLWISAAIEARLLRNATGSELSVRKAISNALRALLMFVGLLMGLQILAMVLPGGAVGDPVSMGRTALLAYLVTGGLAWLADRGQSRLT